MGGVTMPEHQCQGSFRNGGLGTLPGRQRLARLLLVPSVASEFTEHAGFLRSMSATRRVSAWVLGREGDQSRVRTGRRRHRLARHPGVYPSILRNPPC
jgi:hypothetical protein